MSLTAWLKTRVGVDGERLTDGEGKLLHDDEGGRLKHSVNTQICLQFICAAASDLAGLFPQGASISQSCERTVQYYSIQYVEK